MKNILIGSGIVVVIIVIILLVMKGNKTETTEEKKEEVPGPGLPVEEHPLDSITGGSNITKPKTGAGKVVAGVGKEIKKATEIGKGACRTVCAIKFPFNLKNRTACKAKC